MENEEGAFLDRLYGAVLDSELWTGVLEEFADLVGGTSSWLSRRDRSVGGGVARMDPALQDLYFNHYAGQDMLSWRFDEPPARTAVPTDEDRLPKEAPPRTEFYQDFMRRVDAHSVLMIDLGVEGGMRSAIHINRPAHKGQFEKDAIHRAKALRPHFSRALRLARRAGHAVAVASSLAAGTDAAETPVILLETDGRIAFANRGGHALMNEGGGFAVHEGRLVTTDGRVDARLDSLIRGAADPALQRGESFAFAHGSRPLTVTATPVKAPDGPFRAADGIALSFAPAGRVEAVDPMQRLRHHFGLTPAEGRVALLLLEGRTPGEVAEHIGTRVQTVRNQLRNIFAKVGVSRQGELIRTLLPIVGDGGGMV